MSKRTLAVVESVKTKLSPPFETGRQKAQQEISNRWPVLNALNTESDKIFEEGYRAGKKRIDFKANPYTGNKGKDWAEGYSKAEVDSGIHSGFRKGDR